MPRNALGRGLSALIRESEPQPMLQQPAVPPAAAIRGEAGAITALTPTTAVQNDGLLQVDIDLIDPSPYQPRTHFREQALEELAISIQANGIIQPIVLRKAGVRFQLIAG